MADSRQPRMSWARRIRGPQEESAEAAPAPLPPETPVAHAHWLLAAAFLLPNLGALTCGFLLDDLPLIVENEKLHSLRNIVAICKSPYWADRAGMEYRPTTQTIWAALWTAGDGRPVVFHVFGLLLGLAVALLAYRFLLKIGTAPRTAFTAALLFALFPIHTEATTSVVGSAELLAAVFGFGALLLYSGGRRAAALTLFALAVFSKESAAAFAALPVILPGLRPTTPRRPAQTEVGAPVSQHRPHLMHQQLITAALAAAVIAGNLLAHRAVLRGDVIAPLDNPMAQLDPVRRILTALWVQCLYLFKTVAPVWLSADYSYQEIPPVMSLGHGRAWAGLALLTLAGFLVWRYKRLRPAVLTYAVMFSATANVIFPIGTMMGERLAYTPSIGPALLLAIPLARMRHWKAVLLAVTLLYGGRTVARNRDWRNPDVFYTRLVETSPSSAKSHYLYGILLSERGDDTGAVAAYHRAIAIFPAYTGQLRALLPGALIRQGLQEQALEQARAWVRIAPNDRRAHSMLSEVLWSLENSEEAVSESYRAAVLARDQGDAVFAAREFATLAVLLDQTGHPEKSLDAYREATRLNPDSADIQHNFGLALFTTGKFEEAAAHFRVAARLNPQSAWSCAYLGFALATMRDFAGARAALAQADRLQPNNAEILAWAGQVELAAGNLEAARQWFARALAVQPANARAQAGLAALTPSETGRR
jgi:Flp pilus assembly protein TadD